MVYATTCSFYTNKAYTVFFNEIIESTNSIGATAYTSDNCIGQSTFFFHDLFTNFFADNFLEVTHHFRIGMGTHYTTQNVESVFATNSPFTHCSVASIFQSHGTTFNCYYFRTQKFHSKYVQRLAFSIFFTHENNAFHTHQCCYSCSSYTVLTCTGFCDYTSFTHFFRQKSLTEYVVNFMRTGVVQIFAFQIDFCTAKIFGHFFCII